MRVKLQGTLIRVDEDPVRDKTELVIRVRTTKLDKLNVEAKTFLSKENALTISFQN